jgi:hypothetical protein
VRLRLRPSNVICSFANVRRTVRLEGILEQALASPPPTRAVLGKALRELVRVAVSQAGT